MFLWITAASEFKMRPLRIENVWPRFAHHVHSLRQVSANTGRRADASPWRNSYRAVRNQGQIGPKVTGTTAIRNTLRVPLTTIIAAGRSILLRQSKPRSLNGSAAWWVTSCNKFAWAKHSLFYWGLVRKIMPGCNWSAMWRRFPTPALRPPRSVWQMYSVMEH